MKVQQRAGFRAAIIFAGTRSDRLPCKDLRRRERRKGRHVMLRGAQVNHSYPCHGASMSKPDATAGGWAKDVAALAVDALLDAGIVPKSQFDAACEVVAEEIYVRLCLNDYPPPVDHSNSDSADLLKRRQG